MELRFSNSITDSGDTYEVYLFGGIGDKVDGDHFARELTYIDSQAQLINLHINSNGGSVAQGMSIVAAIKAINTPVYAYIDGVAASMAAVIAVACERVYMQDYAKMMIHDPSIAKPKLTAKEQRMLDRVTDMLRSILSSRGHSVEAIAQLMTAETWFSATEALEQGLIDQIITSAKTPALENLAPAQLFDTIQNEYKPKTKTKMELTATAASILNVSATASEADISSAVEKLNSEKVAAQERATTAQEKLENIENQQREARRTEATELIDQAILDGRIDAKAKDSMTELFASNHESAKATLAAIPQRRTITSQLGGATADQELLNATWDELDKSGRLSQLKAKYPEVFEQKRVARFPSKTQLYQE